MKINPYKSFRNGCYALILTGTSHLVGHLYYFEFSWKKDIVSAANDYREWVAGASLISVEILKGLSLCYALFFFILGLTCLQIYRLYIREDLIPVVAKIIFFGSVVGSVISAIYFFWLPILSFALAALFFGATVYQLRIRKR